MIFKYFKKLFRFEGQREGEYSEKLYRDHEQRPGMLEEFNFNVNSTLGCLFFFVIILLINIVMFLIYRIY